MVPISFTKMSGSGNDFILIDNRENVVSAEDLSKFAAQVCRRKMSAGADGLIMVESSEKVDFKWQFFNSDGSLAEMCGNGARCVARFAYLNGIAQAQMGFETTAGIIAAEVRDERVKIRMTDPFDLVVDDTVRAGGRDISHSSINTGVPHVVIDVDDIEAIDVVAVGREIRRHSKFAPAGTNVNFYQPLPDGIVAVRTYERGVEDETLACGTGIVAAALTLAENKAVSSPVTLKSRSGGLLQVYYTKSGDRYTDVFLEGDARIVYEGRLMPDAWQYDGLL